MPHQGLQRFACERCHAELAWIQHGEPKEGRLALWKRAQSTRVPLYLVTKEASTGDVHEAEDLGTGEQLDQGRFNGKLQALKRDHRCAS